MKVYRFLYSLGLCLFLAVGITHTQSFVPRRNPQRSMKMTPAEQEAYRGLRAQESARRAERIGFDASLEAALDNPKKWSREFITIFALPDWEKQYTGQEINNVISHLAQFLESIKSQIQAGRLSSSSLKQSAQVLTTRVAKIAPRIQQAFQLFIFKPLKSQQELGEAAEEVEKRAEDARKAEEEREEAAQRYAEEQQKIQEQMDLAARKQQQQVVQEAQVNLAKKTENAQKAQEKTQEAREKEEEARRFARETAYAAEGLRLGALWTTGEEEQEQEWTEVQSPKQAPDILSEEALKKLELFEKEPIVTGVFPSVFQGRPVPEPLAGISEELIEQRKQERIKQGQPVSELPFEERQLSELEQSLKKTPGVWEEEIERRAIESREGQKAIDVALEASIEAQKAKEEAEAQKEKERLQLEQEKRKPAEKPAVTIHTPTSAPTPIQSLPLSGAPTSAEQRRVQELAQKEKEAAEAQKGQELQKKLIEDLKRPVSTAQTAPDALRSKYMNLLETPAVQRLLRLIESESKKVLAATRHEDIPYIIAQQIREIAISGFKLTSSGQRYELNKTKFETEQDEIWLAGGTVVTNLWDNSAATHEEKLAPFENLDDLKKEEALNKIILFYIFGEGRKS